MQWYPAVRSSELLKKLKPGVFVPVITPFLGNGKIDFGSLGRQVGYLVSNSVDGIVIAGTTGEGQMLTAKEKKELIDFSVAFRKKNKKFAIIAGTGTQKLEEAIEIADYAGKKCLDGILALAPQGSQKKVEAYYKKLSAAACIPIIAYNIPKLNSKISPETISRLVGKTNVIGVKDSSQDPGLMKKWKTAAPDAFLAVGEDTLIEYGVKSGNACAAIPGTGNVAPKEVAIAFRQAGKSKGRKAQAQVDRIVIDLLSTGSFGGSLKAILRKRGTIETECMRTPGRLAESQKKSLFKTASWI